MLTDALQGEKTKVAVITANLGGIDGENITPLYTPQVMPQNWECSINYFDDNNFQDRKHAFLPRLRAKIPKMLGWQLIPGHNYYIWLDACYILANPNSIMWLVEQIGDADMAVLKHPDRNTIRGEYEFVAVYMTRNSKFLLDRYDGEPMKQQVEMYLSDSSFKDDKLYHMAAFIYKPNKKACEALECWYRHCCLYSVQDQLSFPYISRSLKLNIIPPIVDGHYVKNTWRHVLS
jgi:hypothetical protein